MPISPLNRAAGLSGLFAIIREGYHTGSKRVNEDERCYRTEHAQILNLIELSQIRDTKPPRPQTSSMNSKAYQWNMVCTRTMDQEGRCLMWIILILLWLLPLSLGLVLSARVLGGLPAVSEQEWRALFRDRNNFKPSLWSLLAFAVFAVMFFLIGVLEGVVLVNIGSYWLVFVPLLTGLAALLLVLFWLRTEIRGFPMPRRPRSIFSQ